jgi:predicted nucleic-acid-binding protein
MIGLDTNILVRYLVEDDPEQTARAAALIEGALAAGERLFIPQVVLCELAWVLASGYDFTRAQIAAVVGDLLHGRGVVVEDADLARRAAQAHSRGEAQYADYLILERCRHAGCRSVASFDGDLQSEAEVVAP